MDSIQGRTGPSVRPRQDQLSVLGLQPGGSTAERTWVHMGWVPQAGSGQAAVRPTREVDGGQIVAVISACASPKGVGLTQLGSSPRNKITCL